MKGTKVFILMTIILMLVFFVQPSFAYEGDNVSNWAREGVAGIEKNGLAPPDLFYDYQKPITREEFAAMVVRIYEEARGPMELELLEVPFEDIYYSPYAEDILKAYQLGIVNGVGNWKYKPNGLITRQEIAVMFYRTLQVIFPKENYNMADNVVFVDNNKIAKWARKAIVYCYKSDILQGVDYLKVGPALNTTREQAMTLAYRLAVKKNIISKYVPSNQLLRGVTFGMSKQEVKAIETGQSLEETFTTLTYVNASQFELPVTVSYEFTNDGELYHLWFFVEGTESLTPEEGQEVFDYLLYELSLRFGEPKTLEPEFAGWFSHVDYKDVFLSSYYDEYGELKIDFSILDVRKTDYGY